MNVKTLATHLHTPPTQALDAQLPLVRHVAPGVQFGEQLGMLVDVVVEVGTVVDDEVEVVVVFPGSVVEVVFPGSDVEVVFPNTVVVVSPAIVDVVVSSTGHSWPAGRGLHTNMIVSASFRLGEPPVLALQLRHALAGLGTVLLRLDDDGAGRAARESGVGGQRRRRLKADCLRLDAGLGDRLRRAPCDVRAVQTGRHPEGAGAVGRRHTVAVASRVTVGALRGGLALEDADDRGIDAVDTDQTIVGRGSLAVAGEEGVSQPRQHSEHHHRHQNDPHHHTTAHRSPQ
jgi:hypothetical protein